MRVKGQNVGTVSTEECLPPAEVFASEEVPSLLEPLFPANAEPKVCFVCMFFYIRLKSFLYKCQCLVKTCKQKETF